MAFMVALVCDGSCSIKDSDSEKATDVTVRIVVEGILSLKV